MYAGLTTTGYPILLANAVPSSNVVTIADSMIGSPIFIIVSLNSSLSSPLFIESTDVPITFTLYFSSIPLSCNSTAKFNAV